MSVPFNPNSIVIMSEMTEPLISIVNIPLCERCKQC